MSRPALALVVLLTWGCESASDSASGSASAANHPASGATSAAAQLDKLRVLEHRRSAAEIGESLLSHRDHDVRRAVARTLARIADPRANAKLLRLLHDEDPTVVAWSAYGLGLTCSGDATQRILGRNNI